MYSLKNYNTYNINSYAKYVYFPNSVEQIIEICKKHEQIQVIGNGSNIILAQKYYFKRAFIIQTNYNHIFFNNNLMYAQAGSLLKKISIHAYVNGLSGLEIFFDIPASIGGAMIMNTGAYGDEIYNHVVYVDTLCLHKIQKKRFYKKDIDFGYRYSMFKSKKNIILGACLNFSFKNKDIINTKMRSILAKRREKLPDKPSAGSVFKRPNFHISVGEMIEQIGLKGYKVGGAQISLKHGGVIINAGNASGKNIIDLINYIKLTVWKTYKVKLELEQIIIYD